MAADRTRAAAATREGGVLLPRLRNERGMLLVVTLVILLVLSTLGAASLVNAYLERSLARNQHAASLAQNAADAGVTAGFAWLNDPLTNAALPASVAGNEAWSLTLADSFTVALPANGKISFYGYRNSLAVENFQLYTLASDAPNNLVVNSSFEYLQEGMPNYMKPLLRGTVRFEGKWEDLLSGPAATTPTASRTRPANWTTAAISS